MLEAEIREFLAGISLRSGDSRLPLSNELLESDHATAFVQSPAVGTTMDPNMTDAAIVELVYSRRMRFSAGTRPSAFDRSARRRDEEADCRFARFLPGEVIVREGDYATVRFSCRRSSRTRHRALPPRVARRTSKLKNKVGGAFVVVLASSVSRRLGLPRRDPESGTCTTSTRRNRRTTRNRHWFLQDFAGIVQAVERSPSPR